MHLMTCEVSISGLRLQLNLITRPVGSCFFADLVKEQLLNDIFIQAGVSLGIFSFVRKQTKLVYIVDFAHHVFEGFQKLSFARLY